MKHFGFVVSENYTFMRIDHFLANMVEESREFVKQNKNSIRVNESWVKLSYKLRLGDKISWDYPEREIPPTHILAERIPLDILFEDDHLLVLDKPAGMVVHPSKGHWKGTLCHALLSHLGSDSDFQDTSRPGIVHRLDKDTSGLMLVAKDARTQNLLSKQFRDRKILKIYTALVQGKLPTLYGKIEAPIGRSRTNRLLFMVDPSNGKEALTEYHVLQTYLKATLVKIRIHTGRTHQIRVHFQHIRHPIIGDPLYSRSYRNPPLCLAATKLGFIHPFSRKLMEFSIPLPPAIQKQESIFANGTF